MELEIIRIGDLGKIITGTTPPKKEKKYYGGKYPLIKPSDIIKGQQTVLHTEDVLTEEITKDFKRFILPRNTICVVTIGSIGKQCYTNQVCMTNQQINSIIPNENYDSKFVYYLMEYNNPKVKSMSSGSASGRENVNKSSFESIKIKVPKSKEAQKKIASILSTYDDLIENNQQRIAILEQMAQNIYKEWFVRFRFPGHEKIKFRNGIPFNWQRVSLREVVEFYIGGGWGKETEDTSHSVGGFVIRGTDIPKLSHGKLNKDIFRYHKPSNIKTRELQKNDIIFEVSGGTQSQLLGRNILISEEVLNRFGDKVLCASFCKLIRTNERISPHQLKCYFDHIIETEEIAQYQVQSTGICNFQFESFLDYELIFIPDEKTKKEFHSIISNIRGQIDILGYMNEVLNKTRNRLLPRLMNGKLKV